MSDWPPPLLVQDLCKLFSSCCLDTREINAPKYIPSKLMPKLGLRNFQNWKSSVQVAIT